MKVLTLSLILCSFGLITACSTYAQTQTTKTVTVLSIGDGDTIRVMDGDRPLTIRLACIDAPETSQPWGKDATVQLQQLLPKGQLVAFRPVERDRYGRTVAEVFTVESTPANLRMVKEGGSSCLADPSDPHRLDRDKDGIACESLPK